ncbi:MAG: DNA primase [Patescibacteria group bacterium]
MAEIVDEIKSRLSIEDVVSQYVQLKKMGHNLKGLCPFHSEKTPSFVVSPEKQICHCFGCNKGGDIFQFVQELEGVGFVDALRILADRAGVKFEEEKASKKIPKSEKDEYYKAHELACDFFCDQLFNTEDGKKVLDYLHRRGVNDETIKTFKIGFAPDLYDALYPDLLKKGISRTVLLKAGLVSSKTVTSDQIYDKYRARLIFPIFDAFGKVCGFGGRTLKQEQSPKYLNSPENPIYNKSKILYGLSHAKDSIKELDKVVVVEGYFDVVLPYQAGIKNIVATSGTALTEHQIKILKRLTEKVVSCFDTDSAGFEATKRAYFLFQEQGIMLKTLEGLDKKDPADFVRDHGVEFKVLVDRAEDFLTFFVKKLLEKNDFGSPSGRKTIFDELLPCLARLSPVLKDFHIKALSSKLNIEAKYLHDEIANFKLPVNHPAKAILASEDKQKMSVEIVILGVALEYPALFKILAKNLAELDFEDPFKKVYKDLMDQYNSARENFTTWKFDGEFLLEESEKLKVWQLYAEEQYSEFSEVNLELEMYKLIDKVKKDGVARKGKQLIQMIQEAEKNSDRQRQNELIIELNELKRQKLLNP